MLSSLFSNQQYTAGLTLSSCNNAENHERCYDNNIIIGILAIFEFATKLYRNAAERVRHGRPIKATDPTVRLKDVPPTLAFDQDGETLHE